MYNNVGNVGNVGNIDIVGNISNVDNVSNSGGKVILLVVNNFGELKQFAEFSLPIFTISIVLPMVLQLLVVHKC